MRSFVRMEGLNGQVHYVNPDQVQDVVPSDSGHFARLVFGAVTGGVHDLQVKMSQLQAVELLRSENPDLVATLGAIAIAGGGQERPSKPARRA